MTTEEKIKVMQAYANGEKIQIKSYGECEWTDWIDTTSEPHWNWEENSYRIKPSMTDKEAYQAILTLIKQHCTECESLLPCEKCDFYKLEFWVEER